MVTLIAGAVAVGIATVCAIPFGCFINRKMKRKKVFVQPEVADEHRDLIPAINSVEVLNEPEYRMEEIRSKSNDARAPRVEIRVFVSNGSTRSIEASSHEYAASSFRPRIIEAGRSSWPDSADGPATNRRNEGGSSSLPVAVKIGESGVSDTTKFEITISGPFSKSVAHFGDFKNDVPDSSTPKSRKNGKEDCGENCEHENIQRSSFWRRASFSRNGQPRVFKTTRDIEVMNVDVIPGVELRQRRDAAVRSEFEKIDTEKKEEKARSSSPGINNENRKPGGSSKENGAPCDRGRWGIPARFFDSFKETTSFATL